MIQQATFDDAAARRASSHAQPPHHIPISNDDLPQSSSAMDPALNEELSAGPQVALVDEADMLALPPADGMDGNGNPHAQPGADTAEQLGLTGETSSRSKPSLPRDGVSLPTRPPLKREGSVPMTPQHLPPPAPPAPLLDPSQPTDSLSLMQLRALVRDMPKPEPTPYTFRYEDASSMVEEVEEWFSYSLEEQAMILKTKESFRKAWWQFQGALDGGGMGESEDDIHWVNTEITERRAFMKELLVGLSSPFDYPGKIESLEALAYIALGSWYETAGLDTSKGKEKSKDVEKEERSDGKTTASPALQLEWMKQNLQLLIDCDGLQPVYDSMRDSCLRICGSDVLDDMSHDEKEAERREMWCSMTIIYMILEYARIEEKEHQNLELRTKISKLNPNLLTTMIDLISRIRWDESIPLPVTKVLLLNWKALLVCLGPLTEVERIKDSFRESDRESADKRGQPLITASPLDYHAFRQEISSKYPAYEPPPPLFPLEPENNSILPPLKNHPSKAAGSHVFGSGLANLNGNGTSILNQPVHIATPAPSPPPSPAGPGGKGGKKQNYQTNQLFPFLYPPLDEESNKLGGKGSTDLQDLLVGRKWEGSDIPTSILEAAELFAKRMRASRAMKQLWEERVAFMKFERGWITPDDDVEELDLSASADGKAKEKKKKKEQPPKPEYPPGSIEERLETVEEFYKASLPHLQSLVIVLVRMILLHVTTLLTQASSQNEGSGINGEHNDMASSNEELDAIRTQEILDKAVSGTLIVFLKWFKVSHILKFEYITQLLVDSSYIPLILKLLQLQEIERLVNFRCDRDDLSFFNFCLTHSRQASTIAINSPEEPELEPEPDSEDDAMPPPIRRQREGHAATEAPTRPNPHPMLLPEVDELGFPTSELPAEPITTFSWRAFFTSINYLRIMQKICKGKTHRNLMLVSYKSSQFLRKALKVPQPELRLYTLKLFKNQVPYCGRKWRQGHMRVITAVYLHCRPALRDDWLAGADVDADVDASVPLEQALRALTHWWNLRRYPDAMGAAAAGPADLFADEQDFFRRELEKMDWSEFQEWAAVSAAAAAAAAAASQEEAAGGQMNGPGPGPSAQSGGRWEGNVEGWA